MTAPTTTIAITERPAKTPNPIGSTEMDFPGRDVLIAAATVGTVSPLEVVTDTSVPEGFTEPVVVAVAVVVTEPVVLGVVAAGKLLVGMAEVPRSITPPLVAVATIDPVDVAVAVIDIVAVPVPVDTESVATTEDVCTLLDAVAVAVVAVSVVGVLCVLPLPPPLVSGVSTQVSTITTLSVPDGVNVIVQVWMTGLPLASVVAVVVVVVVAPVKSSSLVSGRAPTFKLAAFKMMEKRAIR